ncbi:hypothetical protein P7C70_g9089, partial [Phenoliferia sp. Uapishka_3]
MSCCRSTPTPSPSPPPSSRRPLRTPTTPYTKHDPYPSSATTSISRPPRLHINTTAPHSQIHRPSPTYPQGAMPPHSHSLSQTTSNISPKYPSSSYREGSPYSTSASTSRRQQQPWPPEAADTFGGAGGKRWPSPFEGGSDRDSNGRRRREAKRLDANTNSSVERAKERMRERERDEGKLCVGIDFGPSWSRQVCPLLSLSPPLSPPLFAPKSHPTNNPQSTTRCEWFKLFLSPSSLASGQPDPRLPPLPYGKDAVDVIADFLSCIWKYAKGQITEQIGTVADLDSADVLLTVPAAWDAAGCALMREAAIRANLVQSSRGGDKNWRDRLRIITEPEAAAIHASTLSTLHNLSPSQTFIICDAGGGTVDTAVYQLIGQLSQLEIAEMCVRSGSNSGSLFVDLKFEELIRDM